MSSSGRDPGRPRDRPRVELPARAEEPPEVPAQLPEEPLVAVCRLRSAGPFDGDVASVPGGGALLLVSLVVLVDDHDCPKVRRGTDMRFSFN